MMPHGEIHLSWQDNTLVLSTEGPFNLDGANQCFAKLKCAVKEQAQQNWQRIDLIDEAAFGEPAVMKVFGQTYLWAFEHGCQALALVCKNIIQQRMCINFIQSNHYTIEVFQNQQDAMAWLAKQAN